jgi:lipopolysaccharide export system protein LptA
MSFPITRLRHWLAITAIVLAVAVTGMYLYARWRVRNALKDVPHRIGLEVQQSAEGFTVSKSEQGRTVFTIRASKAVQFKAGGRAELQDVNIIVYGRDSTRFDQIYGSQFTYDPQSGEVSAKGEVQIDLEANPGGVTTPDQAPPRELRNPIHLRTSGLVFNQKTGNAYTGEKIEFHTPQASGSAVGANYVAQTNLLTLRSKVEVAVNGPVPSRVTAARGTINKELRQILLDHPHLLRGDERLESDAATLFLGKDNRLERVIATGDVQADVGGRTQMQARAEQAELQMGDDGNRLRGAVFSGKVQIVSTQGQPLQGDAGRIVLDFTGKNQLDKVRAEDGVNLAQHQLGKAGVNFHDRNLQPHDQDVEITAPAMDFFLADGKRLDRAETLGAAQVTITQAASQQRTVATAGKFDARFGQRSELVSVHGAPEAKIVSSVPGQPDRTSASNSMDVAFVPGGGVGSIVQQGHVTYVDDGRKAWGDMARYSPADETLVVTGSPRVEEGGMTTTARVMRLNRATSDAVAEGEVKSTYSELKQQPEGALLASSDPIHVTSQIMTAHRTPAVAVYSGGARLWQDANMVEAASIQFDRDNRAVVAQGDGQPVSTVLVQVDKSGNATPVAIKSARLTYRDAERKAHFSDGVSAKGADVTITAKQMDVFLAAAKTSGGSAAAPKAGRSYAGTGQLEKIVAEGNILIQQPSRHATGEHLAYVAADDKFVLTGGPPSIFDAEHGKITGDSLTFYRRDDRVLVEGREASPTVTTTRVAR